MRKSSVWRVRGRVGKDRGAVPNMPRRSKRRSGGRRGATAKAVGRRQPTTRQAYVPSDVHPWRLLLSRYGMGTYACACHGACPTLSGYVLKIIEDPSPTEAMSCHCIHKQEQRTYVIIINTYCPLAIVPGLAATCGNGRPFYAGNCNNDVHIAIET